MSLDDLADDDVMIALLDDAGDAAFDRGRCGVEDRDTGRALVDGLPAQLANLQLSRVEEVKAAPFWSLPSMFSGNVFSSLIIW